MVYHVGNKKIKNKWKTEYFCGSIVYTGNCWGCGNNAQCCCLEILRVWVWDQIALKRASSCKIFHASLPAVATSEEEHSWTKKHIMPPLCSCTSCTFGEWVHMMHRSSLQTPIPSARGIWTILHSPFPWLVAVCPKGTSSEVKIYRSSRHHNLDNSFWRLAI